MITDEYQTTEQFEMAYLHYRGIPIKDFDRTNPHKIIAIFGGDVALIRSILKDFWDCNTRVDARTLLNAYKSIKQSLWVGGKYDPSFAKSYNKNENKDIRKADKQEKQQTNNSSRGKADNDSVKSV